MHHRDRATLWWGKISMTWAWQSSDPTPFSLRSPCIPSTTLLSLLNVKLSTLLSFHCYLLHCAPPPTSLQIWFKPQFTFSVPTQQGITQPQRLNKRHFWCPINTPKSKLRRSQVAGREVILSLSPGAISQGLETFRSSWLGTASAIGVYWVEAGILLNIMHRTDPCNTELLSSKYQRFSSVQVGSRFSYQPFPNFPTSKPYTPQPWILDGGW